MNSFLEYLKESNNYPTGLIIRVDMDQTLCDIDVHPGDDIDYKKCFPIKENIEIVNKLKEIGNTIIIWTARGSHSGIDWTEVTENQLKEWGCNFDKVEANKPYYDLNICDKCINNFNDLDNYLNKFKRH